MLPARRLRAATLACVLASLFVVKAAPLAQREPVILIPGPAGAPVSGLAPSRQQALAYFRGRIAADGEIGVIVEARAPVSRALAVPDEPQAPDAPDSAQSLAEQRLNAEARQRVIRRLPPQTHPVREYDTMPFFALIADAATLNVLLSDPNVVSIQEDFSVPPALSESVPLIQGTTAWEKGFRGDNMTVAILDSGVEKAHPTFGGGVISEACYSGGGKKASSLCRNQALSSTANNSAAPCTYVSGCFHGTHVAAIVAGNNGVARLSWIIAMQVFSKEPANESGLGAKTSDLIKALERVYALRTKYSIASVNMSIGGGGFTKTCDSQSPSMVSIINKLYEARIAVVVASGNDGYYNGVSWPACHAKAVSVGNTTKTDKVNSSSNAASFLRLLAPGTDIYAATTGGSYRYATGTSMAAPHVAGTWAILVQKTPSMKVDAGLAALRATAFNIRDSRNNLVFKRIRINNALNKLKPLAKVTLATPSVTSASLKPKYSWSRVAASTSYRLWVQADGVGSPVINIWYSASDVCTSKGCSVTPTKSLKAGQTYTWEVQTYEFRMGPFSAVKTFTTK